MCTLQSAVSDAHGADLCSGGTRWDPWSGHRADHPTRGVLLIVACDLETSLMKRPCLR